VPHRHRYVAIENVSPGMRLSDDLTDIYGNVLLTKGSALTSQILEGLRRHNIAQVPIQLEQATTLEQQVSDTNVDSSQHKKERLAYLFRKMSVNDEEATPILYQYVERFRLGETS
jgi:hypothetical protein